MKKWKELYKQDLSRYGDSLIEKDLKRFYKYFRVCQTENNKFKLFSARIKFRRIKRRMKIDLYGKTKIGGGLYLGHPYGITINSDVIIGNNCNLSKGVTIGQENRGARKGSPIIGNRVWVGVNATIVGKIVIGDDVLIAPNSFVNCDVPSHSIVIGNPCRVINKDNATENYIENCV